MKERTLPVFVVTVKFELTPTQVGRVAPSPNSQVQSPETALRNRLSSVLGEALRGVDLMPVVTPLEVTVE